MGAGGTINYPVCSPKVSLIGEEVQMGFACLWFMTCRAPSVHKTYEVKFDCPITASGGGMGAGI